MTYSTFDKLKQYPIENAKVCTYNDCTLVNGFLSANELVNLNLVDYKYREIRLREDAAESFNSIHEKYLRETRHPLVITDSYRCFDRQVQEILENKFISSIPGTSMHGWGLSLDIPRYISYNELFKDLINTLLMSHGWICDKKEYWHWDFRTII